MSLLPVQNTLESGQVDTTAITTGNSGGGAGSAFDTVTGGAFTTYSTTHVQNGTLAAKFDSGATNQQSMVTWSGFGSLQGEIDFRFYLYLSALPVNSNAGKIVNVLTAAAGVCGQFVINTSGHVVVNNAAGSTVATGGGVVIPAARWVRIEGRIISRLVGGVIEMRSWNNPTSTWAPDDIAISNTAVLAANVDRLDFGLVAFGSSATQQEWMDDLTVTLANRVNVPLVLPRSKGQGVLTGISPSFFAFFQPPANPVAVGGGPVANQQPLAGALTFTGSGPQNAIGKLISGILSFTGAKRVALSKILAAAVLAFTGAQTTLKSFGKAFAAVLTFTGAQTTLKSFGKALSAALTFTGAQSHAISTRLSGVLTFTGARAVALVKLLAAVVAFTGATTKRTAKLLAAATLTFTGATSRRTAKLLAAAALSFTGALGTLKSFGKQLTANLTPSGDYGWITSRTLSPPAVLSFTSNQTRATTKGLAAAVLSFTGNLLKRTARPFIAALSFTGAQTTLKSFGKLFTATLTFTGAQRRAIAKLITAILTFTGAQARAIATHLTAAATFTGVQLKRISRTVTAVLSSTGTLASGLLFKRTLTAVLAFTGAFTTRSVFGKTLTATLTFTGAQARKTTKLLAAILANTSTSTLRTASHLAATLTLTGLRTATIAKKLAAIIAFTGTRTAARVIGLTAVLRFAGQLITIYTPNPTRWKGDTNPRWTSDTNPRWPGDTNTRWHG